MLKFLESHKVILVYIPLVIYWIILLVLTSLPAQNVPEFGLTDKINHFLAYLVLAVLLKLTLLFQNKSYKTKINSDKITIIVASVYGMLDEIHQLFVPGRSAEFLDWLADFLGIIAGIYIMRYIIRADDYKLAE